MQMWNRKKEASKSLKNRFGEGFGLHLGGVWDGLGPLLDVLGGIDFGRFWGGIWEGFGRFWEGLGRLLWHLLAILGDPELN